MRATFLTLSMTALLGLASGAVAQQQDPAGEPDTRQLADQGANQTDEYSFALWPQDTMDEEAGSYDKDSYDDGDFLYGDPYFKNWARPMGMPFEFEDPFINTDVRFIYMWHQTPNSSRADKTEIQTWAMQGRLAITDRLQFIVTKTGYTKTQSGLDQFGGDGWNDFEIGLKYAFWVDHASDWIMAGGVKWEWNNGSTIGQKDDQVLQPFLSMAKKWDKIGFIGHVAYQIPTNRNKSTQAVIWNMNWNYELFDNFFPLVEFHGIHRTSNGGGPALGSDALDLGSFGSSNVSGTDYFGAGLGFRWMLMEGVQLGATYEFPIENVRGEHLQHQRININLALIL